MDERADKSNAPMPRTLTGLPTCLSDGAVPRPLPCGGAVDRGLLRGEQGCTVEVAAGLVGHARVVARSAGNARTP